ncbi:MAG: hypothetical protein AABX11_03235 [Nanoarchaeota archaeon]
MDEAKRLEIEKQARKILDDFGKSLSGIKIEKKKASGELGGFRKEGQGKKGDNDFRERMFLNAPRKEGDFIIAETKSW